MPEPTKKTVGGLERAPCWAVSCGSARWALAHGFAKTVDHSHLYIATGHSQDTRSLQELQGLFGKLHFFCINDTTDDAHDGDPRLLEVRQMLSELLPNPSVCEMVSSTLGLEQQAMQISTPQ